MGGTCGCTLRTLGACCEPEHAAAAPAPFPAAPVQILNGAFVVPGDVVPASLGVAHVIPASGSATALVRLASCGCSAGSLFARLGLQSCPSHPCPAPTARRRSHARCLQVTAAQLADPSAEVPCYDMATMKPMRLPLAAPWPTSCQVPIVISPLTTLMVSAGWVGEWLGAGESSLPGAAIKAATSGQAAHPPHALPWLAHPPAGVRRHSRRADIHPGPQQHLLHHPGQDRHLQGGWAVAAGGSVDVFHCLGLLRV